MKPTQFRYTTSLVRSRDLRIIAALFLPVLGLAVFWFMGLEKALWEEFWQTTQEEVGVYGLILLLGAAFMVILWAGSARTSVTVSPAQLLLNISPLTGLGLMGCTTGDHRIPVDSISGIRLVLAQGAQNLAQALQQSRLEIITGRHTYVLQPYNFLQVEGADHRPGMSAFMKSDKLRVYEQARQRLREAPLVQSLAELPSVAGGISWADPESTPASGAGGYNLLKHRGMALQLGLLVVVGSYALLDFFLLMEHQVLGHLPQLPFLLGGTLAAVVCFHLGKDAPGAERAGVGVLVVLAAVLAVQPGLKRYALLVAPEAQVISYQATAPGWFQHPDYPAIDMRDGNLMEYWHSQPPQAGYDFHIHVTDLGYHLLDLRPLHEKTRAFYADHP